MPGGVNDNDIVNAIVLEGSKDFGGEFVGLDADRARGHELLDGLLGDGVVALEGTDKIAMSKDTGKGTVGIDDDSGTAASHRHGLKSLAHSGLWRNGGKLVTATHDVADAGEEGAAKGAPRVELGEVRRLNATSLQQGHGQSITQNEHCGGARGGRKIEGAGLLGDVDIQDDIGVFGEG